MNATNCACILTIAKVATRTRPDLARKLNLYSRSFTRKGYAEDIL